jgi:hypothetical protein
LRDIHRIRLIETIADTMKPAPMVRAMRIATAAAMIAVHPVGARTAASPASAGGRSGGFTYSPVINAQGAAPGVEGNIKKMLQDNAREVYRIVQEQQAKSKRTDFKS